MGLCPVAPVALVPRGGDLHQRLVIYKAAREPALRSRAIEELAADLFHHLVQLTSSLRWGDPIVLVPVPSTGPGRTLWKGTHPLVTVGRTCCTIAGDRSPRLRVAEILRRGPDPLDHCKASRSAYATTEGVRMGARSPVTVRSPVIVIDDLYTSGAHAQSAAAALRLAGLDVRFIVPIGRLVAGDDARCATTATPRKLDVICS